MKTFISSMLRFMMLHFFFNIFFKLWKYDNTFMGDLENTEQGSTIFYNYFLSR